VRILLVNAQGADLAAGGSGRYVADLARGLAARGHAVHVLAGFPVREDGAESTTVLHDRHWRESNVQRLINHAVDVVARPGRALRDAIESTRPELVHTNNLPGFSTAVWEVARSNAVPVVHTLHDYHLLCPRSSLTRRDGSPCCPHQEFCSFRTRRLARWSPIVSHVICGSDHLWAREGHLFPKATVETVRVPIVPLAAEPLRAPRTPPTTLGYLGGLDPIKGVRELLAAAGELDRFGLTIQIAGDGRLRAEVERHPRIDYVGPVSGDRRIAFFERSDIAVVPSTWEEPNGPPYVVAEWLAAGRPVLASNCGGLAEAQSLSGVVAIEPTAGGIVNAVRPLLDVAEWSRILSQRLSVTDGRDFDRWLDQHEATYERALAARRASTSS
jgi:glycosyltransferase involved in cell wall biosynthesis